MTRLDHNRAMAQLAAKTGTTVNDITKMTIWGNHSATQYPDLFHAEVDGKNAAELVGDQAWLEGDFIPTVQQRGAAIIEARGLSSAPPRPPTPPSTTCTTWVARHPRGRLGVDGHPVRRQLRRARGPDLLVPGAPRTDGEYSIVQGLDIDEFSRARIDASVAELAEERDAVKELGLI